MTAKTRAEAIANLTRMIEGQRAEGQRKGFDFAKPSFFTRLLATRERALAALKAEAAK